MSDTDWRAVAAEFIGTFMFVTIGAGAIITTSFTSTPVGSGNGAPGLVGIALAHGIMLSIVVSAFGAVSGGHFNPAVSIAMLVTRRLSALMTLLYVIAQLLAAILAGLVLRVIFDAIPNGTAAWQAVQLGTPVLAPGVSFVTGNLLEGVLTFFLLIGIFGTAVDPRALKIGGFGVGLTVGADILLGGPFTGASMNPARTFGPAVASGYLFTNPLEDLVYWIGPIIGGVLAALVYQYIILPRKPETT